MAVLDEGVAEYVRRAIQDPSRFPGNYADASRDVVKRWVKEGVDLWKLPINDKTRTLLVKWGGVAEDSDKTTTDIEPIAGTSPEIPGLLKDVDYLARIRILWGDGFMQTMDAGPKMGSNLLVGVLTATFFVNGVSEGGKGLGELYELSHLWRRQYSRARNFYFLDNTLTQEEESGQPVKLPLYFRAGSGPKESSSLTEAAEAVFVDVPFDVDEYP